jgi:hypothetical protein
MSPMVQIARRDRTLEHHRTPPPNCLRAMFQKLHLRTGEPPVAIRERVAGPNDTICSLIERNVTIGTAVPNNDREWRARRDSNSRRPYSWSGVIRPLRIKRVSLTVSESLPLFPRERLYSGRRGTSHLCPHRKSVDFIDHFVGAFFLDKASRLCEQQASAVLVIVWP